MRIGLIGGTGLRSLSPDLAPRTVATPWGDVSVDIGEVDGLDVAFIARHGADHTAPPHRLPHQAHMAALRALGVEAVLGINNVGALQEAIRPGALVVPDDLIDFTGRVWTMFDDEVVHVGFAPPYCPHLRRALLAGGDAHDGGTYVQSTGPRLETAAEVRHLARLGDVVGMTGAPEATLAREAGMCYASLCFVANHAAGIGQDRTAQEIEAALAASAEGVVACLRQAVGRVSPERDCGCRDAARAGRLGSGETA